MSKGPPHPNREQLMQLAELVLKTMAHLDLETGEQVTYLAGYMAGVWRSGWRQGARGDRSTQVKGLPPSEWLE